jgi:lysozyme
MLATELRWAALLSQGTQLPYGPNPTVNQEGLDFIASHEGFRSEVYNDPAGNPTIGYGHLITAGESFPKPITREQGLDLLRSDIRTRVDPYFGQIGVALSQRQINALGSFVYNVGGGAFSRSTLLREVNAGNFQAAGREFGRWVYAGGQVQPGLVIRRQDEAALFLGGP